MKKRILVIEDDSMMAEAIQDRLEANGFKVVLARTKTEALAAFKANPKFFAMLVDGWIDGESDTCDLIREIRKTYRGHMVAMSSKFSTLQDQMIAGCSHEIESKTKAAKVVIELAQNAQPEAA